MEWSSDAEPAVPVLLARLEELLDPGGLALGLQRCPTAREGAVGVGVGPVRETVLARALHPPAQGIDILRAGRVRLTAASADGRLGKLIEQGLAGLLRLVQGRLRVPAPQFVLRAVAGHLELAVLIDDRVGEVGNSVIADAL